jgi:Na+-driven multidrug efflux pump
MGVAGAAVATLVAIVVGIVWLTTYFVRPDAFLRFDRGGWRPNLHDWRRMLAIGLPAGFEFAIMALYMVIVYSVTRPFGAAAQAGFGIGQRVVQSVFMPVVALGFAVAPVAGQNFGARLADRVVATFRDAALMATAAMAVVGVACHFAAAPLVGIFTADPAVVAVGAEYLRIISWNFVASGLIFVASSMFQAMGNTLPSLVASATRIVLIAVPVVLLSRQPGFHLRWIWYISVGAVLVQLVLAMLLLRREFARRLRFDAVAAPAPVDGGVQLA